LQKYVYTLLTQRLADKAVGTTLRKAGKRMLRERRERNERVWQAFLATPANEPFVPALVV
jgi:hypothetical protein